MREIKFRAWDKENKRYVYIADESNDTAIWFDENGWYVVSTFTGSLLEMFNDNNGILEMSTGLYDKNGKEIYEGSGGVHNEFGAYYIKYGMYREPTNGGIHHGYYVKFIDRKRNRMFRKDLGYWARIRTLDFSKNIYENPELLEEK